MLCSCRLVQQFKCQFSLTINNTKTDASNFQSSMAGQKQTNQQSWHTIFAFIYNVFYWLKMKQNLTFTGFSKRSLAQMSRLRASGLAALSLCLYISQGDSKDFALWLTEINKR